MSAATVKAARDWIAAADAALRDSPVRAERGVPLRGRTSLGVGGPAPLLLLPERVEDLALVLKRFRDGGVPFEYLGAGSNLLVGDAGPPFVVIASENLDAAPRIEGAIVRVGAGYQVPKLAKRLLEAGLAGLEFAEGIPGSVGGCARMNAGWHDGAFGGAVVSLTTLGRDGGLEEIAASPGMFAYRKSPGLGDRFVTAATLRLAPDDPAAIRERMRDYRARRVGTQPTGARNAGCVFKNPPGDHAGRIIDALGLKGRAVGPAIVSEVHANFIVNRGGATAADVVALIEQVRAEVERRAGVVLEEEVIRWM